MASSLCDVLSEEVVSDLQSFYSYFPIRIWLDMMSGPWDQFLQFLLKIYSKGREGRKFLCCQCRPEELHSSVSSYQFLSKVYIAGDLFWSLYDSDFLNMFFLYKALLTVQESLRRNLFSSYHQFFSVEKNIRYQF